MIYYILQGAHKRADLGLSFAHFILLSENKQVHRVRLLGGAEKRPNGRENIDGAEGPHILWLRIMLHHSTNLLHG